MLLIAAVLCIIISYMSGVYNPIIFFIGFCIGYIVNALYFGAMLVLEKEDENEEND